jgi:hypothetical protein
MRKLVIMFCLAAAALIYVAAFNNRAGVLL